ncbi:unnamed protein product [Paramecium pentaurelia]|uniref:Myb-like domain-containing protein n=1 Tax=Paramecium pentaurelia TaxID=43138 RepID=A0A8S1VWM4_9CILI|nr:unnamed protein product [Paramecium pentaurelia]
MKEITYKKHLQFRDEINKKMEFQNREYNQELSMLQIMMKDVRRILENEIINKNLNFTEVIMGKQRNEGRPISRSDSQYTELVEILYECSVQMSVGLFNDQQNFCQIQLYKYIDKSSLRRMKFKLRGVKKSCFFCTIYSRLNDSSQLNFKQKQSMQSNPFSYSTYPYQFQSNFLMNPQVYYSNQNPYYSQVSTYMAPQPYLQNESYHMNYIQQSNYINWNTEQTEMKLPKITFSPYIKQEDNLINQTGLHAQNLSEINNNEDNQDKLLQKVETVRQVKKSNSQIIQNRRGHWTNEEHYKYLKFVRQHKELFQTSVQKKLNRVFKMMSIEIPTRTACQCRSHYSKFNPLDHTGKVRRKLVNDEQVYERMFNNNQQNDSD